MIKHVQTRAEVQHPTRTSNLQDTNRVCEKIKHDLNGSVIIFRWISDPEGSREPFSETQSLSEADFSKSRIEYEILRINSSY